MINLRPTTCNICGGRVEYISNAAIYGKEYCSGKCYYCSGCGAYVGTHIPRPLDALGILANVEMRALRIKCHTLFDQSWRQVKKISCARRRKSYAWLAAELGIPFSDCHFGYFDLPTLKQAFEILTKAQNKRRSLNAKTDHAKKDTDQRPDVL